MATRERPRFSFNLLHRCAINNVTGNVVTARTVASIYPEFSSLFTTLYGTTADVNNTSTVVTYDSVGYRYTEVYTVVGKVKTLRGYFLEFSGNVLYLEHLGATGTLNQYDWNGSAYAKTTFNLNGDPNYAIYGFSPVQPVGATGKFLGFHLFLQRQRMDKEPVQYHFDGNHFKQLNFCILISPIFFADNFKSSLLYFAVLAITIC